MTNERKEMIRNWLLETIENEEFSQSINQTQSPDELKQLFASFGLEVTSEEINEMAQGGFVLMQQYAANNTDELTENELEAVVGGGKVLRFLGSIAGGAALGFLGGLTCYLAPAATPYVYGVVKGYTIVTAAYINNG